jgi:nucleoside-diphosphate-sugar epimerase
MAKIAVTGSTGFIGRNLIQKLLQQGHIVYPIGRDYRKVECDRIYHLACPSSTRYITEHTNEVVNIIVEGTCDAIEICPTALFINASSMGVNEVAIGAQQAYNEAKKWMEIYLEYSDINYINYRIPSVYGTEANEDNYVVRCVNGEATYPKEPNKKYYISHIDDVVDALVNLTDIKIEEITLGQIYELFNSGRRRLHRTTSDAVSV